MIFLFLPNFNVSIKEGKANIILNANSDSCKTHRSYITQKIQWLLHNLLTIGQEKKPNDQRPLQDFILVLKYNTLLFNFFVPVQVGTYIIKQKPIITKYNLSELYPNNLNSIFNYLGIWFWFNNVINISNSIVQPKHLCILNGLNKYPLTH